MCSKKLFRLTMCQSCIKLKKKIPKLLFVCQVSSFAIMFLALKKCFLFIFCITLVLVGFYFTPRSFSNLSV